MLTSMNAVAALLHTLDFMAGMNGGKGVILDFVGQGESLINLSNTHPEWPRVRS